MKISQFFIYTTLRLNKKLGKRQSLIVHLVDENGKSGVGEIAPLPGRSIESFDEALSHTVRIKEKMLSGNPFLLISPPSVMFGIDSALCDLNNNQNETTFEKTTLSFEGDPIETGIKDVKVKASDSQKETYERIRKWLDSGSKVRLDVNTKWSVPTTIDFVNRFNKNEILYIEDPVPYKSLDYFIVNTDVAIALDEVVSTNPIESLLKHDRVGYIIIKPTLIGGTAQCQNIVLQARKHNKTVVFSSAFESVIGLSHIVRMGKTLGCSSPFGVDTLKYFSNGFFPGENQFQNGSIIRFDIEGLKRNEMLPNLRSV